MRLLSAIFFPLLLFFLQEFTSTSIQSYSEDIVYMAISLTLNKNPQEYANDCLQKRLGIKNNLNKGDTLLYYKCNKQEIIKDSSGNYQTKNVSDSDDPWDISYSKYKEMLINSIKDVIEILGYDIERDLLPKKILTDHYLSPLKT